MDVAYFLKKKIDFIRQFYDTAAEPFLEKKRKIEVGEEPFIPPYSEDSEPPFLDEWMEADESLQVLGYSCLSLLSSALHLNFQTWEQELGAPVGDSFKAEFKRGWINGYKAYFTSRYQIDFSVGPADLSILEEIPLARNRFQHSDEIVIQKTRYSSEDMKKLQRAFFVDERDQILNSQIDGSEMRWLFPPNIHVTPEKLATALTEVEKFSDWLEAEIKTRIDFRQLMK